MEKVRGVFCLNDKCVYYFEDNKKGLYIGYEYSNDGVEGDYE